MSAIKHKTSFPVDRGISVCHRMLVQINPADIAWLVNVVESYEAIAIPRTIDQKEGIVELLVSPDYVDEAVALMESLGAQMHVRILKK
jgi:hypothetical protein